VTHTDLCRRDRAVLVAVAAGRCSLVCGSEPDLLVDNLWFCDQHRVHCLISLGLLTTRTSGHVGCCLPAVLTAQGGIALELLMDDPVTFPSEGFKAVRLAG
jgi:hypothetical protein